MVDVIVPMYNEVERVEKVLTGLRKVRGIDKLVVVDDGSIDGSGEVVSKKFPQVTLLTITENGGKAAAINRGMRECGNDAILLFDADYVDFEPRELEEGVGWFLRDNYEMIVFRHLNDAMIHHWLKTDLVISGLRIVKKEVLEKALTRIGKEGYRLEIVINEEVKENDGKVGWVWLSGKHTVKLLKRGAKLGLKEMIKMTREQIGYKGGGWLVKHILLNDWRRVERWSIKPV